MNVRCIGLSGPDGAGKSSVAHQLLALLQAHGVQARVVHLYGCFFCRRWGVDRRSVEPRVGNGPRASRTLHALVDVADLRVRMRAAELLLAIGSLGRRREQPVLITDRSPLDGLVKFLPERNSVADRLYRRAAERYDAIAVLDAPTDVLVLRDREHGAEYLAAKCMEFRDRGGELPNVVHVESGDASPEELASTVWSGFSSRSPVGELRVHIDPERDS